MNALNLFKAGAEWCGVVLLVVVTLPVVALVLFVLRFAALGLAALVVAAGLAAYCLSPPFRRRAKEAMAGEGQPPAESR